MTRAAQGSPKPRRFYVTLSRGERMRCLPLKPATLYLILGAVPVLLGLSGAGLDALLASDGFFSPSEAARTAELRADYNDRISALREQISEQAKVNEIERSSLLKQIDALAKAQKTLAARSDALVHLTQAGLAPPTTEVESQSAPLADQDSEIALPLRSASNQVSSIQLKGAPQAGPKFVRGDKPHPEGIEIVSDHDGERTSSLNEDHSALRKESDAHLLLRLAQLRANASRLSAAQANLVKDLAASTEQRTRRIEKILSETGLSVARLQQNARRSANADFPAGGPFIPVRFDAPGSPPEQAFLRLQKAEVERLALSRALSHLPLLHPLVGPLDVTSPFGERIDPFLDRLAMHPGLDLRAALGTPVRATGSGAVTNAGPDGGYGIMVQIDHGDGVISRYGHLSQVLVHVGEKVAAGQIIGRTGETGRATGPHLHYEVRLNDQPVNPERFLEAGRLLSRRPPLITVSSAGEPLRHNLALR